LGNWAGTAQNQTQAPDMSGTTKDSSRAARLGQQVTRDTQQVEQDNHTGKNQVLSLGTGCTNCWKLETRDRWPNLLRRRGKALWWRATAEQEPENEWRWATRSEADGGWKVSALKTKLGAPSVRTELEAPKWNSLEATETWTPLAQRGHNSVGVKSTRATKEEHTRKILLKHNVPTRNTEEKSSTNKLNWADLAQQKGAKRAGH
jgi:hypothetical protein